VSLFFRWVSVQGAFNVRTVIVRYPQNQIPFLFKVIPGLLSLKNVLILYFQLIMI